MKLKLNHAVITSINQPAKRGCEWLGKKDKKILKKMSIDCRSIANIEKNIKKNIKYLDHYIDSSYNPLYKIFRVKSRQWGLKNPIVCSFLFCVF